MTFGSSKLPSEMQVGKSEVLTVSRPLCGISEPSIHRFSKYSGYHQQKLG